jgi:hypothetical protein
MNQIAKYIVIFAVCFGAISQGLIPDSSLADDNSASSSTTELPEQVSAQDESAVAGAPEVAEVITPPEPLVVKLELPEAFLLEWQRVESAIDSGVLSEIESPIIALTKLRTEAGFEALEDYSLILVSHAQSALSQDPGSSSDGRATFFIRKAFELSPDSLQVLLAAFPIVKSTQMISTAEFLLRIVGAALRTPNVPSELILNGIYPFLWAITIALYVTFVLFFLVHTEEYLRSVAYAIPLSMRGFLTPVIAFGLLIVPLFLWPLWCLFGWGILFLLFVPQRRWLGFVAGSVLVLWGTLIPLRESLHVWLQDPGTKAAFRVYTGVFKPRDADVLRVALQKRSEDGFLAYTYALLLRRLGYYDVADQGFVRAEAVLGDQPYTKAQRGIIAFLTGNPPRARELFESAQGMGLTTPEFLFDYSKVKFDLMDTAGSRALFEQAYQMNKEVVTRLRNREEMLGLGSEKAVAEIQLPLRLIVASAWLPLDAATLSLVDEVAYALMPGLDPLWMVFPGVGLILLFLVRGGDERQKRIAIYYVSYSCPAFLKILARLWPGGSWILGGKPAAGWMIGSCVLFLVMPLIGWPGGSAILLKAIPALYPLYLGIIAVAICAVVYIGFYIKEQNLDAFRRSRFR